MNRSALIAVLLTLSIAACEQKDVETTQVPTVTSVPATEQAPAAASEAVPAKADEE